MKRRTVVFSPRAQDDLLALGDFIAERSGSSRARSYIERLEAFCDRLAVASERGDLRSDVYPGLRAIGFQRSATVLFVVTADAVQILRIHGKGFDWTADFSPRS